VYCTQCGDPVEADARFCAKCGTPIRRTEVEGSPATSRQDATAREGRSHASSAKGIAGLSIRRAALMLGALTIVLALLVGVFVFTGTGGGARSVAPESAIANAPSADAIRQLNELLRGGNADGLIRALGGDPKNENLKSMAKSLLSMMKQEYTIEFVEIDRDVGPLILKAHVSSRSAKEAGRSALISFLYDTSGDSPRLVAVQSKADTP